MNETIPSNVPDYSLIYELLYTALRAKDVLASMDINANWVDAVWITEENLIEIHYQIDQQKLKAIVSISSFLMPFWSVRRHRANGYDVELIRGEGDRLTAVCRDLNSPDKQPHQVFVNERGVLVCSCEDYGNQVLAFQQQPYLWNLIGQQPRCKHVMASAVPLERTDVLQMPIIRVPGEAASGSAGNVNCLPVSDSRSVLASEAQLSRSQEVES
jgi:hypothetical protein